MHRELEKDPTQTTNNSTNVSDWKNDNIFMVHLNSL